MVDKKIKSTEMQTQQLPIWKLIFEQNVLGIFAFTAILTNNGTVHCYLAGRWFMGVYHMVGL